MKKQITTDTHICDNCGKQQAYIESCLSCGKEFCYDCEKTEGIMYRHAVHFEGSGDGFFCNTCLGQMNNKHPKWILYQAYAAITNLRNEEAGWYKDFDKRSKVAEAKLKGLL